MRCHGLGEPAVPGSQLLVLSFHAYVRPDGEDVHAGAFKAGDGFLGFAYNRFIFVEAGVHEYGNSSLALEGANQLVVERILLPADSLQTSSIVYVIDGGELGAFFWTNLVHVQHERRRVVVLEILALAFLENRGGEGTKPLALLDARVQDVFHSLQARMSQDGAVA